MDPIKRAMHYSFTAHFSQKYGEMPYFFHILQVVKCLEEFGYTDPDLVCSAYLHDIIEDTSTSFNEVEELWGTRVARMVWAVTGKGQNRREKLFDTITKLTEFPEAVPVKMADRLANMRSSQIEKPKLYRTYKDELIEYETLFKNENRKMFQTMFLI